MLRPVLALGVLALLFAAPPAPETLRLTLPNQPGSVKFLAMGDYGTGERPQYDVAARMNEARQQFPFDFVITLGDNLYGSQKPADFVNKFERPYKPLLDAGVPFFASLGNHDRESSRNYPPFNMHGERYYTYARGSVRFFALDSNKMDAAELGWLTAQLQIATEPWKVAYFHHPIYSSAVTHGSDTGLRQALEPLFVQYGVNAVFAGHDHVYERIRPQHGIYYFVSGAAGQLRPGDLQRSPLTAVGFDGDQSFMLVEIERDALALQVVSRRGRVVDSVRLPRQPPGGGTRQ